MRPVIGDYKGHPKAGEVWRRRKGGKTETRFVIDRTLGGDVIYRSGKWSYANRSSRDTYLNWMTWQSGATRIDRALTEG